MSDETTDEAVARGASVMPDADNAHPGNSHPGNAHPGNAHPGAQNERRDRSHRRWPSRYRAAIRRNRPLDLTWRVLVSVVGTVVLVGGLVMFLTPGPGWVATILGLAILSTEFKWAERLLHKARDKAREAQKTAMDPARRKRNLLLSTLAVVAVVGLAWWWVAIFGWPGFAVSSWELVRSWF